VFPFLRNTYQISRFLHISIQLSTQITSQPRIPTQQQHQIPKRLAKTFHFIVHTIHPTHMHHPQIRIQKIKNSFIHPFSTALISSTTHPFCMIVSEPKFTLQFFLCSGLITTWAHVDKKLFKLKVGENQKSYIFTPFQLKIHAHPHAPMHFK
jgi:hypothetical protein